MGERPFCTPLLPCSIPYPPRPLLLHRKPWHSQGGAQSRALTSRVKLMKMHSFVAQLCRNYTRDRSYYLPGPGSLGLEDPSIIETALGLVRVNGNLIAERGLVLAGYSRGGLNAAAVSRRLALQEIEVDLLILLDPVDRDA